MSPNVPLNVSNVFTSARSSHIERANVHLAKAQTPRAKQVENGSRRDKRPRSRLRQDHVLRSRPVNAEFEELVELN